MTTNEDTSSKDLKVYVFNSVEDEWGFISSIPDAIRRYEYITDAEDATDAYFMAMATQSNFVYISPKPISDQFINYCQNIFNFKDTQIITPQLKSHLICNDLVDDSKTFDRFVTLAKKYKRIVLTSYAATSELYSLKQYLQRVGIEVYTPEAPRFEASWTVNFYGSKSGIRQLAQQSVAQEPDFIMPEGIICVGSEDAASIAANRYLKNKAVVIKTNKGSGGSGVLIFRDGELSNDYRTCKKQILDIMKADRYWDLYPVIIEDMVNINYAMSGGFPNVEFKIHKNGRIEMLYVCACQVTPKGKFEGVDISESIINDRIQTRMEDTGYFIAEKYAAAGYRGHFDVDMIAAKNGQIYVCESNTRNTGGTDTYKIIHKLLGKNFMDLGYTLSRSRPHWITTKSHTLDDILKILDPILYNAKTKTGLIINSENSIPDGKLIYTVIGKNRKDAYRLESEMIELLRLKAHRGSEFPSRTRND